jgi:hypothetical protein
VLIPLPVGDLDKAQPVAPGDQAHGFGIDRDGAWGQHAFGEIFFVEIDSHIAGVLRPIAPCRKAPRGIV